MTESEEYKRGYQDGFRDCIERAKEAFSNMEPEPPLSGERLVSAIERLNPIYESKPEGE